MKSFRSIQLVQFSLIFLISCSARLFLLLYLSWNWTKAHKKLENCSTAFSRYKTNEPLRDPYFLLSDFSSILLDERALRFIFKRKLQNGLYRKHSDATSLRLRWNRIRRQCLEHKRWRNRFLYDWNGWLHFWLFFTPSFYRMGIN